MRKGETNDWLPVSDLETGFNENKLPSTDDLAGKEITFFLENGRTIKLIFQTKNRLVRELAEKPEKITSVPEVYEAIKIAPGLYFVDFVKKKELRSSMTITLDLQNSRALVIESKLPTRKESDISFLKRMNCGLNLSPVTVDIFQAAIGRSFKGKSARPFERTEDLIGIIAQYTYSRQHTYEHYYMNHRFYAWQCLQGPEKGTADADYADYFKIAPNIYQFIWREKVVPTAGIVLIDFNNMRSTGKIFGLDIPTGKPVNFTMGAFVKIIKDTRNDIKYGLY